MGRFLLVITTLNENQLTLRKKYVKNTLNEKKER